jgi:hypothetical protein
LEELLTEYEDIFAEADEDNVTTNKVYHCRDTGDARRIRQPPRRIPLAKQADVKEFFDKMQRHGVIEESESPSFWSRRSMGNSVSVWTTGNGTTSRRKTAFHCTGS